MPGRRERARRGAAIVETAIVLVLFLTLVFGILDLGRAFLAHIAIDGASAIASEYGTTADSSSQTGYPSSTQVKDKAQAACGPAIDLALATITVDTASTVEGLPALSVTIKYSFPLVSPFLGFAFPGNVAGLTATAVRVYP